MRADLDVLDEILTTLARNRGRALLTALGVGWGTFLLVLMLGFGDGLEQGVIRNMRGTTTNAVYVWGRRTYMPYDGLQPNRPVRFVLDDAGAIEAQVPGVVTVAPRSQLGGYRDGTVVRHGDHTGAFQVMGDTPAFAKVQIMRLEEGRWINQLDLDDRRKVTVLGRSVVDELFPDDPFPVGEAVEIQGVWFQVVGVFDSPRGDEQGDRESSTTHIPLTTFQQVFHQGDRVGWFALLGADDVDGEVLEQRVRALQAQRHRIHPDDSEAFGSWNAQKEFTRVRTLFGGIRMFTWVVGAATLLSGVVGVSNILLITIRERTKELGLRRAIGATPGDVIGMVMAEAITLTTLAGCVGLIGGVAAVEVVRWYVGPHHASLGQPNLDVATLLGAAMLLVAGGAVAGLLPATRAAAIEPVQALRSE